MLRTIEKIGQPFIIAGGILFWMGIFVFGVIVFTFVKGGEQPPQPKRSAS